MRLNRKNKLYFIIFSLFFGITTHAQQNEEGWRWRNSLDLLVSLPSLAGTFPNPSPLSFRSLHQSMEQAVHQVGQKLTGKKHNLGMAKVTLVAFDEKTGQEYSATIDLQTHLPHSSAQLSGKTPRICIFHSSGAQGQVVPSLPSYETIGLDDMFKGHRNTFPTKLLYLFQKKVPEFSGQPFMTWSDGQSAILNVASKKRVPYKKTIQAKSPPSSSIAPGTNLFSFKPTDVKIPGEQTYFHSEQWALLFFATYFDQIMDEAWTQLKATHSQSNFQETTPFQQRTIKLRLIILHVYTELDPCRACAESLAMFSLWTDQPNILNVNKMFSKDILQQLKQRDTRFLVMISGSAEHTASSSRSKRGFDGNVHLTKPPVHITFPKSPSPLAQEFSPYNIQIAEPASSTPLFLDINPTIKQMTNMWR